MKKPFNSNNYSFFVLCGEGLAKINRGGTFSFQAYVDNANAHKQGPGVTIRYVTSKDDKGRDKGKYFTWGENHRKFLVREGEKDINGVTQYDFLKFAPECEGSPNGAYDKDNNQIGVMYREMNEAKDAEVALEADGARIKAQAAAYDLDVETLAEVAAHIGVFAKADDPENKQMRVRVIDWAARQPDEFNKVLEAPERFVKAMVRKAVSDGTLTKQGEIHYWGTTMLGVDENSTIEAVLKDAGMHKALSEKVQLVYKKKKK